MMTVVASGLRIPEGPDVDGKGGITFTEQGAERVSRLDGDRVSAVGRTLGAPNSAVHGADGALYVCQNGGVVGAWRAPNPVPPQIQRLLPDGTLQTVATHVDYIPLRAPNDLAFGPDGRLYFTDPAQPFDPGAPLPVGRIFALGPEGGEWVLDVGGVYCNGLAFLPDGRLVWAESYTRAVCVLENGQRRVLCTLPEGQVPDGLAVARDGRLFVATCGSHGVTVLGPAGEYHGLIELDADANATNCCFVGSTLYVTDFGMAWADRHDAGRLWRVETDAVGAPVHRGALA